MPLITTHYYFANDAFNLCSKKISNLFKSKKNIYELFAQSFDLFKFYEFFTLKSENLQEYCHTNNTDEFFLNFIESIKIENQTKNPEILAALYGHLTHYVLDSSTHPFIVYKTGFYNSNKPDTIKYKGLHTNMEMQLDAYFYEKKTKKNFTNFKIHKHLITKEKLSKDLINILNSVYEKTFNIKEGGIKYQKGQRNMYYSYKFLIEDRTGIKRKIYQGIDILTPKKKEVYKYFSSHIKKVNEKIFNNEHNKWHNPWLSKNTSNESFLDLYNKALKECVEIFEKTNAFIENKINEKEYKKFLENKSYLTGLPWKQKVTIKHLEF